MNVILFLIPVSVAVAALFLGGFIWAVRSGQYEDTCTPSMRILTDEPAPTPGPADNDMTEGASPLKPEQIQKR